VKDDVAGLLYVLVEQQASLGVAQELASAALRRSMDSWRRAGRAMAKRTTAPPTAGDSKPAVGDLPRRTGLGRVMTN
jgi:hypothetical protein